MTSRERLDGDSHPGAVGRGKGLLKALAILLLAVAIFAWIALGVAFFLDVDRGTWITLTVIAAVGTEALFWVAAALLGVSVVEARQRIWRWMTGRGA